jgi:hypothetical protein
LLSINHKCTQHCYFPLLLKPAAQKMRMVWNSLTRSSRLALPLLHILVDYGAFRCSASMREPFSLLKDYLCNNYTLFMTFGITVNTFVCMCGINAPDTHMMSIQFWSKNQV